MNLKPLKQEIMPAPAEKVRFVDGMLVTDADLSAAMQYPVDVFRTLTKSFFGCGIVCGLDVEVPKEKDNYLVTIKPGVALDCHGYPIQLCKSMQLDLTQDPCQDPLDKIYIAIRHTTSHENPRPLDECAPDERAEDYQCTRIRDYALVKVFNYDDLPVNTCAHPEPHPEKDEEKDPKQQQSIDTAQTVAGRNGKGKEQMLCDCLKECPGNNCCDEAWVLLACLRYDEKNCILVECDDCRHPQYVKPIECLCKAESAINDKLDDLETSIPDKADIPDWKSIEQLIDEKIEKAIKKYCVPGKPPYVREKIEDTVSENYTEKAKEAKAAEIEGSETSTAEEKRTSGKSSTRKTTSKKQTK